MRKSRTYQTVMFGVLLSATGCGAIPDVIVEAARDSAKEALLEVVDDMVSDVINDTVGGWLEFPDLSFDDFTDVEDDAMDDAVADDPDEQDMEDSNNSGPRR